MTGANERKRPLLVFMPSAWAVDFGLLGHASVNVAADRGYLVCGEVRGVRIFVSYCRRDASAVLELEKLLETVNAEVWYDADLVGGQEWWDTILSELRRCDAVVFCVSPDSVRSRACGSELEYAGKLGKTILPVEVAPTNLELLATTVGKRQTITFTEATPEATAKLIRAVMDCPPAPSLADPLPEPPDAPETDLASVREQLAAPVLAFDQQQELVAELERHVGNVDVQVTLRDLLDELLRRPELASPVREDLQRLARLAPVEDDDASDSRRTRRGPDREARSQVESLLAYASEGQLTPIVGYGLADSTLGSRRWLARSLASKFDYPMAKHEQDDLAGVAQFVTVTKTDVLLRSSLRSIMVERLKARGMEISPDAPMQSLVREAWHRRQQDPDPDPYAAIARLPCKIFVDVSPWGLMAEALRTTTSPTKKPEVELCRWNTESYDGWPPSIFEKDPNYVPTVERPLVFQVFGSVDVPDSLVITEDDYLDFAIGVTQNRSQPDTGGNYLAESGHEVPVRSAIPIPVQRAFADSALLLLGFELDSWDVRVLLRTLLRQEGNTKLKGYPHVAAQVDMTAEVMSADHAHEYLDDYFGSLRIKIYWGTVDDFTADLGELLSVPT